MKITMLPTKTRLRLLLVYFAALWILVGFMVFRYYDVRLSDEVYKFRVTPVDPYDPFRGRYVSIRPDMGETTGRGEYVLPVRDNEGYVVAGRYSDSPAEGYIKNLSITRYYMDERLAPRAERVQRSASDTDDIYVLVAVKGGRYVIKAMYVNGVPIEEYVLTTGSFSS